MLIKVNNKIIKCGLSCLISKLSELKEALLIIFVIIVEATSKLGALKNTNVNEKNVKVRKGAKIRGQNLEKIFF